MWIIEAKCVLIFVDASFEIHSAALKINRHHIERHRTAARFQANKIMVSCSDIYT